MPDRIPASRTPYLTSAIFLFCLLFAASVVQAATGDRVGRVVTSVGKVQARGADGAERPLKRRSPVLEGDTLITGPKGRAQIRFKDGALVALRANTEFVIDEYRFTGAADGTENAAMRLLRGGMRTITGVVGRDNKDRYKVDTPVATIGIRGTHYGLMLCAAALCGQLPDGLYGGIVQGAIGVGNNAGVGVFGTDQYFHVADINTLPKGLLAPPGVVFDPHDTAVEEKQEEETKTVATTTVADDTVIDDTSAIDVALATDDDITLTDSLTTEVVYETGEQVTETGTPVVVVPTGRIAPQGAGLVAAYVENIGGSLGAQSEDGVVGTLDFGMGDETTSATLDANGKLVTADIATPTETISFDASGATLMDEGGTSVGSAGVVWGVYGSGYSVTDTSISLMFQGPAHFMVSDSVTPGSAIPTLGTSVTFNYAGGTSPTDQNGTAGSVDALNTNFTVNFSVPQITSANLAVNFGSVSYDLSSVSSSSVITSQSGVSAAAFEIDLTGTCSNCGSPSIFGFLEGFFIGSNAEGAISAFGIQGSAIVGTAVFTQAAAPPPPVGAPATGTYAGIAYINDLGGGSFDPVQNFFIQGTNSFAVTTDALVVNNTQLIGITQTSGATNIFSFASQDATSGFNSTTTIDGVAVTTGRWDSVALPLNDWQTTANGSPQNTPGSFHYGFATSGLTPVASLPTATVVYGYMAGPLATDQTGAEWDISGSAFTVNFANQSLTTVAILITDNQDSGRFFTLTLPGSSAVSIGSTNAFSTALAGTFCNNCATQPQNIESASGGFEVGLVGTNGLGAIGTIDAINLSGSVAVSGIGAYQGVSTTPPPSGSNPSQGTYAVFGHTLVEVSYSTNTIIQDATGNDIFLDMVPGGKITGISNDIGFIFDANATSGSPPTASGPVGIPVDGVTAYLGSWGSAANAANPLWSVNDTASETGSFTYAYTEAGLASSLPIGKVRYDINTSSPVAVDQTGNTWNWGSSSFFQLDFNTGSIDSGLLDLTNTAGDQFNMSTGSGGLISGTSTFSASLTGTGPGGSAMGSFEGGIIGATGMGALATIGVQDSMYGVQGVAAFNGSLAPQSGFTTGWIESGAFPNPDAQEFRVGTYADGKGGMETNIATINSNTNQLTDFSHSHTGGTDASTSVSFNSTGAFSFGNGSNTNGAYWGAWSGGTFSKDGLTTSLVGGVIHIAHSENLTPQNSGIFGPSSPLGSGTFTYTLDGGTASDELGFSATINSATIDVNFVNQSIDGATLNVTSSASDVYNMSMSPGTGSITSDPGFNLLLDGTLTMPPQGGQLTATGSMNGLFVGPNAESSIFSFSTSVGTSYATSGAGAMSRP